MILSILRGGYTSKDGLGADRGVVFRGVQELCFKNLCNYLTLHGLVPVLPTQATSTYRAASGSPTDERGLPLGWTMHGGTPIFPVFNEA